MGPGTRNEYNVTTRKRGNFKKFMLNQKSILKPIPIGAMIKWIKDADRAYFEIRI